MAIPVALLLKHLLNVILKIKNWEYHFIVFQPSPSIHRLPTAGEKFFIAKKLKDAKLRKALLHDLALARICPAGADIYLPIM